MTELKGTPIEVPIELLVRVENGKNPNSMTPEEYAALRENIRTNGYNQPILVSPRTDGKYDLADGHHRMDACVELGYTHIPAYSRRLTWEQITGLRVAMNAIRGRVNLKIVKDVTLELIENGMALEELSPLIGYDVQTLNELVSAGSEKPHVAPRNAVDAQDSAQPAQKPWVLELQYVDKKDYDKAKKALNKAAGKTRDLGLGLLALLGEKPHEPRG